MKAKVTVGHAGVNFSRVVGDIVEGDLAVKLCSRGLALPITDEAKVERATAEPRAKETATARRPARKAD